MLAADLTLPFLHAFDEAAGIAGEPIGMDERRAEALRRFGKLGFPTRKMEAWRFTDLRPLTATPILPAALPASNIDAASVAPLLIGCPTHLMVLVNGRYAPELSRIGALPEGVFLGPLAEAMRTRPDLVEMALDDSDLAGAQAFASLNAAFFMDGVVASVAPGVALDRPIEIVHLADAASLGSFHTRSAIVMGAGSRGIVVETAAGSGASWTNAVTAVTLAESATLRHVKIQAEAPVAIHTSLVRARLGGKARYEAFGLTLGARLSRQETQVAMAGEGASLALNGAYLLRGDQEATIAAFVDHQAFGCRTNEVLKGVMDDRAHGIFLGSITVRPGADQTNANQLNRNLLLSPHAWVDTKPELEIFADDVKCSHGATVGSLDQAALFYLLSRGIDEATARHMLIEAFAADVIDLADLGETLGAHLRRHVQIWLGQAGERR